jgi:tetratricopeptide (TPR) repeat protein
MRLFLQYIIPLIFGISAFSVASGQDRTDTQLASSYFKNKEYDKAVDLYEKLYDKTKSKVYFNYYLKCLLELDEHKKAERTIKKQIRKYPDDLTYYVELGDLYETIGEYEKASETYDDAIKEIGRSRSMIIRLSNEFLSKRKYEYAEKTYLQGRKKMKNYDFHYELATVYSYQRNYEKMIDEYLDLLFINEKKINNVQARLQYYITNDFNNNLSNLLKTSLLKRIQEYPEKLVYNEMLVWMFIQEKNFEQAFLQTKAIDRRFREDGKRVIELALLSVSNEKYDIAIQAYQYVIDKGTKAPFYSNARMGLLNVYYKKVVNGYIKDNSEIQNIENYYITTINDLGKSRLTIKIMKDLAHLQAYYLNKPEEALDLINSALAITGIPPTLRYECKLEKGDILLILDDIWEATLIYAQVEQDNKHNPIGHEAKFRKAKLAYYTGDFLWAQAQLDILKASTSKLIANDAFELSMLIKDNLQDDSTGTALRMFSGIDLLIKQNRDSIALLTLDSILEGFSKHSIIDEVYYKKAQIFGNNRQFEKQLGFLQYIVDNYSYDLLADNALFTMAKIYDEQYNNKNKAMEYYKKLLTDHPGSIYVIEARKRFRELRGDFKEEQEIPEYIDQPGL